MKEDCKIQYELVVALSEINSKLAGISGWIEEHDKQIDSIWVKVSAQQTRVNWIMGIGTALVFVVSILVGVIKAFL